MTKKEILTELLKHRYAHRGLHDKPKIPENSMASFGRAVLEGFGIELDVHLTEDNRLAVIHDSSLKRTCGVDKNIENLTLAEAQEFFLEESMEKIPDFREVLKLVAGQIPLIVELKVANRNQDALCRAVLEALDGYEGLFCLESFNPEAVKWLRVNRPDIVRGQLAGALKKGGAAISATSDFLLRNLWVNAAGKPDFVAYQFEDRAARAFRNYRGAKVLWTIRSYEGLKEAEALGAAPIFEKFNPKDYEDSEAVSGTE